MKLIINIIAVFFLNLMFYTVISAQQTIPYSKIEFKKDLAYYKGEEYTGIVKQGVYYFSYKDGIKHGYSVEQNGARTKARIKYTNGIINEFCILTKNDEVIFCLNSTSIPKNVIRMDMRLFIEGVNLDSIQKNKFMEFDTISLYPGVKYYTREKEGIIRLNDYELNGELSFNCSKMCMDPVYIKGLYIPKKLAFSFNNKMVFVADLNINNTLVDTHGFITVIMP